MIVPAAILQHLVSAHSLHVSPVLARCRDARARVCSGGSISLAPYPLLLCSVDTHTLHMRCAL